MAETFRTYDVDGRPCSGKGEYVTHVGIKDREGRWVPVELPQPAPTAMIDSIRTRGEGDV